MISVKNERELEIMRKACKITAAARALAGEMVRPGVTTKQIDKAVNPPKVDGVCDLCGAALTVRKDDAPETVKNRLKVFHAETEPLKDFYKKLGNLKLVEGNQPIENATRDILAALGE